MAVHLVDCAYAGLPGAAAAYVVTTDDGAYVVETNTARATDRILAMIGGLGLSPADITHVIITHVHLDHAGGASALLAACPNATLLAHPRAAPHAIDPSKLVASATQVYGAATFAELYGTIEPIDADRVRTLADEETLEVGGHRLRFLHTRGHANHHFCVVDEAEGAVFTGDSFGIRYPGLPLFPSTSPTDFDAALAIDSVHRIAATGAHTAWLTHFGAVRNLPAAAAGLAEQLAQYGALVDTADASGAEGDALLQQARTFVGGFFDALVPDATDAQRELMAVDRDLNAQGLAVAVERRRKRRARANA